MTKTLLTNLSLTFKNATDSFKVKSLSKETLSAQLEFNKVQMSSIDATFLKQGNKLLNDNFKLMLSKLDEPDVVSHLGNKTVSAIKSLETSISMQAKGGKGIFGAVSNSHRIMMKLNDELIANLDTVIVNNALVIGSTRLTQGLYLGVIEASRMFPKFNSHLVCLMSHINSNNIKTMPKYLSTYVREQSGNYAKLINQISMSKGRFSVINDITNIREAGIDIQLAVPGPVGSSKLITDVLGIDNIFLNIITLATLPIVFSIDAFYTAKHNYYRDLEDRRNWMENHVAILQMDLEDAKMDPKQKTKLREQQERINYYNDKISKADRELDKYYE